MVEVVGAHQTQHRPEALGAMEPRTRPHAEADARRPTRLGGSPRRVELPRFDQPGLAVVEPREPAEELVGRWGDQRADHRGGVRRGADAQAGHGIAQAPLELRVVVDLGDDDAEAGRRALLAGVAECRPHEVGDRLVDVGRRRDDECVLAARLGEHAQIGPPVEKHRRRVVRTGQHDGVDTGMGDEVAADGAVLAHDELQYVTRHTGAPELIRDPRADRNGLRRRLEDHAVAGGDCRGDATGRDGVREVPGPDDDDRAAAHHLASGGDGGGEAGAALGGVVAAEVDRLAHLWVALVDRLGNQLGHQADRVRPLAAHQVGGGQQPATAHVETVRRPCMRRTGGCDHVVDLCRRVDRLERRLRRCRDGAEERVADRGQGDVGVGLVGEAVVVGRGEQRSTSTTEHVVASVDRRTEPVGFPVELGRVGSEREQRAQEVVGLRVLVEAPGQVGDAGVEVVVGDDRCVHQQPPGRRVHGASLRRRHAFQHFELDAVEHARGRGRTSAPRRCRRGCGWPDRDAARQTTRVASPIRASPCSSRPPRPWSRTGPGSSRGALPRPTPSRGWRP